MNGKTSIAMTVTGLRNAMFIFLASWGCVVCWGEPSPSSRELLAAYVPIQMTWKGDSLASASSMPMTGFMDAQCRFPIRKLSEGQKWIRFEEEFGVRDRSDSMVLSSIQSAKYQLDKTVFALDVFVDQCERAIQMDYDVSRGDFQVGGTGPAPLSKRVYSDPLRDAWENARLRSDVDVNV